MPSSRRWLRLIAPVLLAVPLLAGATQPAALAQDVAELNEIAADTAEVRELPPVETLEPVFMTPAEAQAEIEALMLEEWDAEGAAAAVRSYAALGLLPADTDLLQLNIDLLGEQAGGYYEPESGNIVVIQSADFGAMGAFIYSHEITHALQDAHLGLSELMDAANEELTDDGILAAVSLYEGDASLASVLYVASKPMLALQLGTQMLTGEEVETAILDAAPPIMALGLVFPYFDGLTFVQALYDEGGWAAVNDAYANPPTSTEQIMHVEKYLAGDNPVEISLPDPADVLGDGWETLDDNTLGEFQTAVLLANLAPGEGINDMTGEYTWPEEIGVAAAGWGGDHFQFWGNGAEEAFVWESVWDSEADAQEFFAAFRAYEEGRHGAEFTAPTETDLTLETAGPVVRLVRDGDTVRYVQAGTIEQAEQILSGLTEAEAAAA